MHVGQCLRDVGGCRGGALPWPPCAGRDGAGSGEQAAAVVSGLTLPDA